MRVERHIGEGERQNGENFSAKEGKAADSPDVMPMGKKRALKRASPTPMRSRVVERKRKPYASKGGGEKE